MTLNYESLLQEPEIRDRVKECVAFKTTHEKVSQLGTLKRVEEIEIVMLHECKA